MENKNKYKIVIGETKLELYHEVREEPLFKVIYDGKNIKEVLEYTEETSSSFVRDFYLNNVDIVFDDAIVGRYSFYNKNTFIYITPKYIHLINAITYEILKKISIQDINIKDLLREIGIENTVKNVDIRIGEREAEIMFPHIFDLKNVNKVTGKIITNNGQFYVVNDDFYEIEEVEPAINYSDRINSYNESHNYDKDFDYSIEKVLENIKLQIDEYHKNSIESCRIMDRVFKIRLLMPKPILGHKIKDGEYLEGNHKQYHKLIDIIKNDYKGVLSIEIESNDYNNIDDINYESYNTYLNTHIEGYDSDATDISKYYYDRYIDSVQYGYNFIKDIVVDVRNPEIWMPMNSEGYLLTYDTVYNKRIRCVNDNAVVIDNVKVNKNNIDRDSYEYISLKDRNLYFKVDDKFKEALNTYDNDKSVIRNNDIVYTSFNPTTFNVETYNHLLNDALKQWEIKTNK